MNFGPLLFLGIFLSFAVSWASMVLLPQKQLGTQDAAKPRSGDLLYPSDRSGLADRGREVYVAEGCAACHTQQVRPQDVPHFGPRFTVAQDYLRDQPVQFGSVRFGHDLANIGVRSPDSNWHLVHLYDPRALVEKSPMPKYPYLFEKQKIKGEGSANALKFPENYKKLEAGYEVVPTERALALVAYLKSLKSEVSLFESPLPQAKTNAAPETVEGDEPNNTNSSAK